MAADSIEDALGRWTGIGPRSTAQAAELRSLEAQNASSTPDNDGVARAAALGAVVGGALLLVGLLLFVRFASDDLASLILTSAGGAAALAASWAVRRLRPPMASDMLAGVAAVSLTLLLYLLLVLFLLRPPLSIVLDWVLLCVLSFVIGGAVCWRLRSRAAGALAVFGLIALPLALLSIGASEYTLPPVLVLVPGFSFLGGTFEEAGYLLPFSREISPLLIWGCLSLMVLAATLIDLGTRFAARRGWIAAETIAWAANIATLVLGLALISAASQQGQSWFYLLLLAAAAATTALSIRRQDAVWLRMAARLFMTAGISSLGGIDDGSGRALGLTVLALSFFPFTPLARRRLPQHNTVQGWEGAVWLVGFAVAFAFALAPGAWPAVCGLWGAALMTLTILQDRAQAPGGWLAAGGAVGAIIRSLASLHGSALALALGAVALFATLIAGTANFSDLSSSTAFSSLTFGIILLVAMLAWQQRATAAAAKRLAAVRDHRPRLTLRSGRS